MPNTIQRTIVTKPSAKAPIAMSSSSSRGSIAAPRTMVQCGLSRTAGAVDKVGSFDNRKLRVEHGEGKDVGGPGNGTIEDSGVKPGTAAEAGKEGEVDPSDLPNLDWLADTGRDKLQAGGTKSSGETAGENAVAVIAPAGNSASFGGAEQSGPQLSTEPSVPSETGAQESSGFEPRSRALSLSDVSLPAASSQPNRADTLADEVDAVAGEAAFARQSHLSGMTTGKRPAPVMAEDGSARIKTMHMVGPESGTPQGLIDNMTQIGEAEGFQVKLHSPVDENSGPWTEDYGEYHSDGQVSVVSDFPGGLDGAYEAQMSDRLQRLYGEQLPAELNQREIHELLARDYPEANFDRQGMAAESGANRLMTAQAVAGDKPVREQFSYLEGGNLLAGTRSDGSPYGIVGEDSVALTRAKLQHEMGRNVSREEALEALAFDTGLTPEQLVVVEQPGSFHLDMAMASVRPGEVVLNDSLEAARLTEQWAKERHEGSDPGRLPEGSDPAREEEYFRELAGWMERGQQLDQRLDRIREQAKVAARLQERTAADLEAGGVKVHRMAGAFPAVEIGDQVLSPEMNFLNAEQGIGQDGKRFYVALGGDPQAEEHAKGELSRLSQGEIARIYFLDRSHTAALLSSMGGISCLVKAEGHY